MTETHHNTQPPLLHWSASNFYFYFNTAVLKQLELSLQVSESKSEEIRIFAAVLQQGCANTLGPKSDGATGNRTLYTFL